MFRTLGILVLTLALAGCSMNPKPVVGSANQFDSTTYLILVTTDALIQSTKADLNNGAFPASVVPNVKVALNDLIAAYDTANPVYIAYHNAAIAGTATPAQQAAVTTAMTTVQTATSALVAVKGSN